jgi:hypothetical protein
LFVSCASVRTTPEAADIEAKRFQIEPDNALIYVNEDGAVPTSTPYLFWTAIDGNRVAPISCYRYQVLRVTPGKHTLSVIGTDRVDEQTQIFEGSKIYFFNISGKRGWSTVRPQLTSLSEEQGHSLISHSKRAEIRFVH